MTETEEVFALQLLQPSNGARLARPDEVIRIVIAPNDDPVGFVSPTVVVSETDGIAILNVSRGGAGADRIRVEWAASNVYAPKDITISWGAIVSNALVRVGDRVTWVADQDIGQAYAVSAMDNSFNSTVAFGESFSFTFESIGSVFVSNGQGQTAVVAVICPFGQTAGTDCVGELWLVVF